MVWWRALSDIEHWCNHLVKEQKRNSIKKNILCITDFIRSGYGDGLSFIYVYAQGLNFNSKEFVQIFASFAGYGIAIGYFYVIVVNIIYELLLSKHEEHQAQS